MAARCAGLPDGSIRGDTGPGSGSSPRLEHRQLPVPLRTEGTQRRAAFPSYGQGVPRLGDGTVRSCRFLTARCCQLREFGILKKRRLSQRRHLLKAVLPFSADISPRERSAPAPLTGSGPPPRAAFPLHHLTPRLTSPRPRPFRRLPPEAAAVAPSRGAMAARRCPPRPAERQLRRAPPLAPPPSAAIQSERRRLPTALRHRPTALPIWGRPRGGARRVGGRGEAAAAVAAARSGGGAAVAPSVSSRAGCAAQRSQRGAEAAPVAAPRPAGAVPAGGAQRRATGEKGEEM